MDEKRGIGKNNALMWKIPGELARFKEITMGHPIIMGRKTFESIGRILPGRTNIIITKDKRYKTAGAVVVHSFNEAVEAAKKAKNSGCESTQPSGLRNRGFEIFIIGGGQIFEQVLPLTDRLYLTLIEGDFGADTFFPDYSEFTKIISEERHAGGGYRYKFLTLER